MWRLVWEPLLVIVFQVCGDMTGKCNFHFIRYLYYILNLTIYTLYSVKCNSLKNKLNRIFLKYKSLSWILKILSSLWSWSLHSERRLMLRMSLKYIQ